MALYKYSFLSFNVTPASQSTAVSRSSYVIEDWMIPFAAQTSDAI